MMIESLGTARFPRVLFSQVRQDWRTPEVIFAGLHAEFDFTLDPCPREPTFDGLAISWAGHRVFCNPPYKRGGITDWLQKAREPALAVYLLPVRTTPAWWHDHALNAEEIRFFRKRLRFDGATINAPFDSCLLIYRNEACYTR